MEAREFSCNGNAYIEKVVKQCSCQPREKIEVQGRVVERDDGDGMFNV